MTSDASSQGSRGGWSQRILRRILLRSLSRLREGAIELHESEGTMLLGQADGELQVRATVHHPRFYRRLIFGGGLGAAESLMAGEWSSDDLTNLVRLFIRNLAVANAFDRGVATVKQFAARIQHAVRRNTHRGSSRNIHKHYDLGNDFYRLMLDDTMTYSCGVFEREDSTLAEASVAKIDRACRKLQLRPADHLLEIGTGWGALAIHAAANFGCRVTTTTVSREQHDFAVARVREAGLTDRITVLLQDYRQLRGQFDKLVSIEMIEAVGHEYFETFFRQCGELLAPSGSMLLQSIVIIDQAYKEHKRSVDFIRKYIFPGGCLPSVGALIQAMGNSTDMRLLHLEDISPHYIRTLRAWRERFLARLDDVRELGFPETFIRMWDYYLCYCEATFTERHVNDVQMLLAKPLCRVDPARWLRIERAQDLALAGERPASVITE